MSVLAVVNRKGGTGKSTLAIHLAAYCAGQHRPVLLGDTDPNQSPQVWLGLRALRLPGQGACITARAVDPRNVLRPPTGTRHVVLDTEGGMRGFALSRVVSQADVVLIPVCDALFDREAAAACWAELRAHPRVVGGHCRVAAVGMRVQRGPQAEARLRRWAAAQDLAFIGAVRDNRCYAHCAERGLSLFDLPPDKVRADLAQWAPILDWLTPLWLDKRASPARQVTLDNDPRIHRPLDLPAREQGPVFGAANQAGALAAWPARALPRGSSAGAPVGASAASGAHAGSSAVLRRPGLGPSASGTVATPGWLSRLGRLLHDWPLRRGA